MQLLVALLFSALQAAAAGCGEDAPRPLFECREPLALTLELPVTTLRRQADERPDLPGRLTFVDSGNRQVSLDVVVSTRGHSRLDMCSYPPLSLRFDPAQASDTVFAGQEKLKLVRPCKRAAHFVDYLRQEYGIYTAFARLAPVAFRVRMLDITFRDAEAKRSDTRQAAFFIESLEELAARTGFEPIERSRIEPERLDAHYASIYELFQFMIGNTDWSIRSGPKGEACCHNGKVLAPPGKESGWMVVPYDFDQAGIIGATYALPDEALKIRSVKTRLYRGRCRFMTHLDTTIDLFNERREDIQAALESGGVSERKRRVQARYLEAFYEIVNSPKKRKRHIDDRCRGASEW